MSKPSHHRIIQGLLRLRFSSPPTSIPRFQQPTSSSPFSTSTSYPKFSPSTSNPTLPKLPNSSSTSTFLPRTYCYGLRHYSFKPSPGVGKGVGGGEFAKRALEKPVDVVSSVFSKYRRALGLHLDAFWRRNNLFLFGVGAVVLCTLLWRVMFGPDTSLYPLASPSHILLCSPSIPKHSSNVIIDNSTRSSNSIHNPTAFFLLPPSTGLELYTDGILPLFPNLSARRNCWQIKRLDI